MSRLYAQLQRSRLEAEFRSAVEHAVTGSASVSAPSPSASASSLRGIPVIGKGCGAGAILGTVPGRRLK